MSRPSLNAVWNASKGKTLSRSDMVRFIVLGVLCVKLARSTVHEADFSLLHRKKDVAKALSVFAVIFTLGDNAPTIRFNTLIFCGRDLAFTRLDADAELFLEVGSTAVLCVTEDGLCGKGTRRLPSEGDPTADPALTP